MNDVQMSRIPVQAIAEPQEWQAIREYCYAHRVAVGRFVVEAALKAIKEAK